MGKKKKRKVNAAKARPLKKLVVKNVHSKNIQPDKVDAKARRLVFESIPYNHGDYMARKRRADTAKVSEIGPLPPVVNPERKEACRLDLFKFLTTYFPKSTSKGPFSEDHKVVIADIQRKILEGGRRVNALYREAVKTTIAENTSIWATSYGHRAFALVTGVNKLASTGNIDSIKSEFEDNDLLLDDFPEICFPVRALENRPQRCPNQTCNRQYTKMIWRADEIVLPTIPGSPASGAIITAKPFAKARGVKFKRPDGTNMRPDLILADDIQDDESAANPAQVKKNLSILKKNLIHTAGHDRQAAIIVNGTVLCKNDLIENLLADPAWEGCRIKFMQSPANAEKSFWLDEYAKLRRNFSRSIPGDMDRAHREATALYASRRTEADAGCVISWDERYNRPQEISAIQHAYNILIDDGPEVFASEYQNEPLDEHDKPGRLTAQFIASKTNGLARGMVPKTCEYVTAYVDIHARLLYYVISAWSQAFTGSVIDYGTYPRQPLTYYSQVSAPISMADVLRKATKAETNEDAWILAGLQAIVDKLLGLTFTREDGAELKIGMLLVDARWGEKNALVKQFCRRHPQANTRMMAAQGIGIGPAQKSFDEYNPEPGTRQGMGWRIAPPKAGDRWVTIDVNLIKSFTAGRLALHSAPRVVLIYSV